jgi:DNA helicase IV
MLKIEEIQKIGNHERVKFENFVKAYYFTIEKNYADLTKELVFIDEIQDLSLVEINLIKSYYENANFNFYGDIFQRITSKSIALDDIKNLEFDKTFELNENYRNPIEITEFTNRSLNMNMIPIGLGGNFNETRLHEFINKKFEEDDRVVLISNNPLELFKVFDNEKIEYSKINNQSEKLIRGIINISTVKDIKGLEFDVVAVISDSMSDNEKYVSFTRAIKELYLIKDKDYLN